MDRRESELLEQAIASLKKAGKAADYSHEDDCICAPCEALTEIMSALAALEAIPSLPVESGADFNRAVEIIREIDEGGLSGPYILKLTGGFLAALKKYHAKSEVPRVAKSTTHPPVESGAETWKYEQRWLVLRKRRSDGNWRVTLFADEAKARTYAAEHQKYCCETKVVQTDNVDFEQAVESGADVKAERDRYRKALEFYADPDTYHNLAFVNTQRCPFWHDFGFKGTRFKKRSKGNRGAPGVKARAALIKREEGQNRE